MEHNFHANCVAVEDMEDFWLVGFADEPYNTREYLTLQRSYEDDEQDVRLGMNTYYVERNGQGQSCYGGIERFEFHRDRIKVKFNDSGRRDLGVDEMEITFRPDGRRFGKLKRRLEHVFSGSGCLRIEVA